MTTRIMSIILLFSLGFMACKKESETQPKTTQEKLSGKWNFVSSVTNHFYSGASHITTINGVAGEYADFRNDGKVYSFIGGSYDTAAYGITNDSRVWIDNTGYIFDLKVFTDTDLQMYNKGIVNAADYDETTIIFKR